MDLVSFDGNKILPEFSKRPSNVALNKFNLCISYFDQIHRSPIVTRDDGNIRLITDARRNQSYH